MASQQSLARISTRLAPRILCLPTHVLQLAKSGFYFKPSASSHDNTQCFLCEHALDGWTSEDDANEEHLKHSPECGWAIIQNVVQNELQPATMEDPTSERLSEARRATFKDLWPHDGKRGWHCKTEKMVDGGLSAPESATIRCCVGDLNI